MRVVQDAEAWLAARRVPPSHDAWTALAMLKQRITDQNWSPRERKNLRYRSNAYLKMSSHALWSAESPAPDFKRPRKKTTPPSAPTGEAAVE